MIFLLFLLLSSPSVFADEDLDRNLLEIEKGSQKIIQQTEELQKLLGRTPEQIAKEKQQAKQQEKKEGLLQNSKPSSDSITSTVMSFASRDDIQQAAKKIFENPKRNDLVIYQVAAFLALTVLNFVLKRIFTSMIFRILLFLAYWPVFFFVVSYSIPHFILGAPFDYIAQEVWKVIQSLMP